MKKEQGRGQKIPMKIRSACNEVVPLERAMGKCQKTPTYSSQASSVITAGEGRVEGQVTTTDIFRFPLYGW